MFEDFSFDNKSDRAPRELPPTGLYKGVCVDVVDLGMQKNDFYRPDDPKSKEFRRRVQFVFEIAAKKSTGENFTVFQTYSAGLYDGSRGGKASKLFVDLRAWTGKAVTKFTASDYYGRQALLFVRQEPKLHDPTEFTVKIVSIDPDTSAEPYVASGGYKRYIPSQKELGDNDEVPF